MNPSAPSGQNLGWEHTSGYQLRNTPLLTSEQFQLFNNMLQGLGINPQRGLQSLGKLAAGDAAAYEQIEAPAYRSFDKLLGQISSRYAGQNAIGSSAYENAMSGAGAELAENLAANRYNIQQNALQQLLGQSQNLLGQRLFENQLIQKGPSKSERIWNFIGNLTGNAAGALAGRPTIQSSPAVTPRADYF